MAMGDMKTPDFDDLLAAFDIPDMVDPKAAIESGHDEHEAHGKANATAAGGDEERASDVGVSVIVKNVRSVDAAAAADGPDKDGGHHHHHGTGGLHNGFLTTAAAALEGYGKEEAKEMAPKDSAFNQFSPISSAEEFDDDERIEVDDPPDKEEGRGNFRANVLAAAAALPVPEYERFKAGTAAASGGERSKAGKREAEASVAGSGAYEAFKARRAEEKAPKDNAEKLPEGKASADKAELNLAGICPAKAKSSAKLSSCIAAIAALSARKAATEGGKDSAASSPSAKDAGESPQPAAAEKSPESQSPLDGARKALAKVPDSPRSVSSESSGKASPSSPAGSTPAIPKVRIKTIKTSSGEIKRTVTRVLPEADAEGGKKAELGSSAVTSLLSSPAPAATISSPPRVAAAAVAGSAEAAPKQVTIKPVATAFLPVSAVKTAGSQVINLKLANNTTVKATVISAASVQSAGGAIIKAANAIQQQTVVVPAASLAGAKLVPKTVHLANLNLLPQAAPGTAELRQALSKPQQQIKQIISAAAAAAAVQPSKKVSRVQVVSSLQSSVVEAFNKVLSGVNPVPVYVPNLSPPANAGIALPTRGYKCLECGDSFALEKSLTQHYERRSVRIEVTCNHCTKNLVFYNKCSLLSHARGHKEKGVVMQCSHLILKPVPADQMIAAAAANGGKVPAGAVISAPAASAPAMPLDEDPAKLCRHGLKCLECNEVFQEETALATHFQAAAEAGGQKTCPVCQMLLPNQCSFASHQRIHQHKSPYTCPECGAICRSVHFQTHVTRNCLHYARRVGFRCLHCNLVYSDVAALKSHIQSSHCEIFYKCPICPMAFKSAPGTHSHACSQHPGLKIPEPKLIYKCSMCDTVFTLQPLLGRHFEQHLVESQRVAVFKCPDCSLLYAHKLLMMEHIKSTHGTLKTVEGPPNLGLHFPLTAKAPPQSSAAAAAREDGRAPHGAAAARADAKGPRAAGKREPKAVPSPGWTCWECARLFSQRDVYITHVRKEHGKQMKKHPCRQCDKSFSSSHSLCRHNRIKHKGIRKVYACSHCADSRRTFTKRLLLEKHVQLMHGLKAPAATEPAASGAGEAKEDAKPPSPKRKPDDDDAPAPPRPAITQPLKKLKINVFKIHKCAVCGFTTDDLLHFHEHIPRHKSDGSSHQCRQCGLCYTSPVSLSRHLFIVHKLKEPQHKMAAARQNGGGGGEENQNGGGGDGRKCKVCGRPFEAEAALNAHMRTHGMAFIKSKRMSAGGEFVKN